MRIITVGIPLGILFAGEACSPREAASRSDSTSRAATAASVGASGTNGAVCYRVASSVMGRRQPLRGKTSTNPGWLRLDGATRADSGSALLVDADGAAMPGVWARFATDSIRIRAFDDFLDVRIAATQSDSALGGAGVATSDAELVRDSSGRLRELHREWAVAGRPVACDSLPAPAISSGAPRSP